MKSLVTVFAMTLLALSAQAASAAGAQLHEIVCFQDTERLDYGYQVTISTDFDGSNRTAAISAQTIGGLKPVAKIKKVTREVSTRPGAPLLYLAKNFRLEVNATVSPVNGRMPGQLILERRSGRISEPVLCSFPR